jgi:hypothetical protein
MAEADTLRVDKDGRGWRRAMTELERKLCQGHSPGWPSWTLCNAYAYYARNLRTCRNDDHEQENWQPSWMLFRMTGFNLSSAHHKMSVANALLKHVMSAFHLSGSACARSVLLQVLA